METPINTADSSQESKSKRSPLLIIILVLLLLIVICCILGAVICRGSGGLPDLLDRLSEYVSDPDSDYGDFWGLITDPEGFFADPENRFDPSDDPSSMDATPTIDNFTSLTSCPTNPTEFYLEIAHTWDYSPNREVTQMKVDGSTEPGWRCPLIIDGNKVRMEPCQVPISSEGFVMTDEGPCSIVGTGYAKIVFDEPRCKDGKLVTRIIESIDADAETTGEMVCPGMTQPYFPFFPHSNTPEVFIIQPGGDTQNEYADPEIMNQFKYDKNWTLVQ